MNNDKEVQKQRTNHVTLSWFRLIMLLFAAIILTAVITAFAMLSGNEKIYEQQTAKRAEFVKLYQVYDTLKSSYYKDVNKTKLLDGAIKGMVSGLNDPYSEYMTVDEQKQFSESMSGDFQGIGAELGEKDNRTIIVSPIKGSPAKKAGIKANDEITAINGKSTKGMNSMEVVQKVRGKKGTTVTLSIKRGSNEPFDVNIKRGTIHMDSVVSKMLKNKTALITVSKFQEGTSAEFHKALTKMADKGMKKVILDFRDNPGGYLGEAGKMANEFVDKGDVLFYTEENGDSPKAIRADNPANPVTKDLPAVIILNEGSASASEVFSEALRENDKAMIVGTKSFGKGIVQTTAGFKDESMLKFTQMKWLTPKKNWIHKKGIQPDKQFKLPAYSNIHLLNPDDAYAQGEINSRVKSLETGLKALGYDPGEVDKKYTAETAAAVEAFQTDHHLTLTGRMTGQTTEEFTEALRKKLAANDTQLKGAEQYIKTIK